MLLEEKLEIESRKLEEFYFRHYVKKYPRSKYVFIKKFHHYFTKAASMFMIRDGYDAYKLVESFFMDGFKFPSQFPVEYTWERYENYYSGLKTINEDSRVVSLVKEIISGANQIKKLGSVEKVIEENKNYIFKNLQTFQLRIFFFSKTFEKFYNENIDSFEKKYDFPVMRYEVLTYPKIDGKIRNVLKDDYFKENE